MGHLSSILDLKGNQEFRSRALGLQPRLIPSQTKMRKRAMIIFGEHPVDHINDDILVVGRREVDKMR